MFMLTYIVVSCYMFLKYVMFERKTADVFDLNECNIYLFDYDIVYFIVLPVIT